MPCFDSQCLMIQHLLSQSQSMNSALVELTFYYSNGLDRWPVVASIVYARIMEIVWLDHPSYGWTLYRLPVRFGVAYISWHRWGFVVEVHIKFSPRHVSNISSMCWEACWWDHAGLGEDHWCCLGSHTPTAYIENLAPKSAYSLQHTISSYFFFLRPAWNGNVASCSKIYLQPSSSHGMSLHTHITSLTLSSSLHVKWLTQRCYVWNDKDYKLAI